MKFEGARTRKFVGQFFFICSLFAVFWVSGGCKKIWSKNWIFHGSEVVDREKYSLLNPMHIVGTACCLGDDVSPMTYPQKSGLHTGLGTGKCSILKNISFLQK
jgi:hypothetical protein